MISLPPDPSTTLLPPDATGSSATDLARWREELLRGLLGVALPLGWLLTVMGTAVAVYKADWAMGLTNVIGLGTLMAIHRLPQLSHLVRGATFVLIVAGVGLSFLLNHIGAFGLLWLSAVPVLAALLLGRRVALALLAGLTLGVFSLGYVLDLPLAPLPLLGQPALMWAMLALNFLALNVMIAFSAAILLRRLDQAGQQARQAQQAQKRLAEVDNLTQLPNRRKLHEVLHRQMADHQGQEASAAVLFIDVDNFKDVNDTYGHLEGDRLLVEVAQRLSDQVHAPSLVARTGGDEFVVLVRPPADQVKVDRPTVERLAQRLRQAMAAPFAVATGVSHHTTISVGVSMLARAGMSIDDVMREADTAMYRAKALGRNQVVFFEAAMQAELHERMRLEHDLTNALRLNQFHAAVQSQVDAEGRVVGAEMLLRWTHPARGAVPPAQFIALAEHSGLIVPIGDWVLEQACQLAARLQAMGRDCPLSVNISAHQFCHPDFETRLLSLLATHGVPPQALVLEVTESLMVTHQSSTLACMGRLAAQGLRFSMDDFGTGYSSLSYLKRLPLYELKIDRSFVDDLPLDPNDVAIVKTILSMAGTLGLRVVAEGVETQAQARFLTEHGCHSLQGYLYSRPSPVAQWLATLD